MARIVDEEEKRLEVAQAAYHVIARDGLAGATMRSIAQEAGCSTGMVVHYFRTKQDVLLQAQSYATSQVRDRLVRHETDLQGMALLRATIYEVLPVDERRRSNWSIWMSFWQACPAPEAFLKEQLARVAEWHDRLGQVLSQAVEAGEISPDLDIRLEVEMLAAFIEGLAVQVVFHKRRIGRRKQRQMVDVYLLRLCSETER